MAASIDPIYCRAPDVQIGGAILGPTAITAQDGTGSLGLVFTADGVEGGFIEELRFRSVGTVAQSLLRVFLCTVGGASFTPGTTNTAANTHLIEEFTLPAITLSQTNAQGSFSIPLNKRIGPYHRILVAIATSTGAAGNGWVFAAFGGKF